jgi:hypothetical protein
MIDLRTETGPNLAGEADRFYTATWNWSVKMKIWLNDIASKNPVPGHGGAWLEQKSGRISISGDPLSPSKR